MDDRNLDLDLNLVIDGVKWSPGERVFPLTSCFSLHSLFTSRAVSKHNVAQPNRYRASSTVPT